MINLTANRVDPETSERAKEREAPNATRVWKCSVLLEYLRTSYALQSIVLLDSNNLRLTTV